jgi:hypothetical protein
MLSAEQCSTREGLGMQKTEKLEASWLTAVDAREVLSGETHRDDARRDIGQVQIEAILLVPACGVAKQRQSQSRDKLGRGRHNGCAVVWLGRADHRVTESARATIGHGAAGANGRATKLLQNRGFSVRVHVPDFLLAHQALDQRRHHTGCVTRASGRDWQ